MKESHGDRHALKEERCARQSLQSNRTDTMWSYKRRISKVPSNRSGLGRQTIEVIDAEMDTSTDPFRYRRPRRTWGVFGLQFTFKSQEFEVLCKNIAAAKIKMYSLARLRSMQTTLHSLLISSYLGWHKRYHPFILGGRVFPPQFS